MKFFLNPGHCPDIVNGRMADSGAVNVQFNLKEAELVRDIGEKLKFYLESAGHSVVVLQSNNLRYGFDDDWGDECIVEEADRCGADFAISIHLNAFNQEAQGTECYVYKRGSKADQLAQCIQNRIVKERYRVDRGVKYEEDKPRDKRLSFIMQTQLPAVLIECCFIDNWWDVFSLIENDGISAYAKAIFNGINDFVEKYYA